LERFLRALLSADVFEFDAEQAVLAGQIYADLERIGQPVGRADPMIAAIAIHEDRTLVTGNTEHFERIRSLGYPLRLDDWRSKPVSDPMH
jgi:predicted nucleic acid-binding protein